MEKTIRAIECLNTFQGEGPDVGKRMLLVRFKYCNRKCNFCDTIIKMRNSLECDYKLKDIQKSIDSQKTGILITGGEPTLENHYNDTICLLSNLNYNIANVESNGYNLENLIKDVNLLTYSKKIRYIYSPKIFSQNDYLNSIDKTELLVDYDNICIKIVYQDTTVLNNYLSWLSELDISNKIYLMPEGKTKNELLVNSSKVFDLCEKYRFNFSTRTHIIYSFL